VPVNRVGSKHSNRTQQQTKLQRELTSAGQIHKATPIDAFRLARRKFQAAERIDMSALADELRINRVTLYRWAGSRDQLLVEVLWSLAQSTLERLDHGVEDYGGERIVQVVTGFVEACITNAGFKRWVADEGELAMRLLTRYDTGFQPRLIDAIYNMLDEERRGGRIELPVDLHELAYVIVRLIESYTYLDLITGEQPDAERAEPILRMLLRCDSKP
jgi:AcrR family transcriptional regulator